MSAKPMVSVIMLTYNHAQYIAQAIESVLRQEIDFPIELVIGEDCSTDDTRRIVLDYGDKYPEMIRVITSDANVGAHRNSLRTMCACQGKYIAYCDGDDYWDDPHKLQQQVDFLEKNSDYVLIHNSCNAFNQTTGSLSIPRSNSEALDDANAYDEIITRVRSISTLTVCTRGNVVSAVYAENPECFDTTYLLGDLQLWLEIARYGKVKFLPQVVATYRVLPESTCNSLNPDKALAFELSVQSLIEHYLHKYPRSKNIVRAARLCHSYKVLVAALKANNRAVAKEQRDVLRSLSGSKTMSASELIVYFGAYFATNRLLTRLIFRLSSELRRFERVISRQPNRAK